MSKLKLLPEFVDRKEDLAFLQNLYHKTQKEAQLLILTGRNGVGKTKLLQNFYHKKPHIYFYCNPGSRLDQLQTAVNYFSHEFEDGGLNKKSITTWEKFFEYLNSKLKPLKVPLIIILDEFCNWIITDKNIVTSLNQAFEKNLKTKKVFIAAASANSGLMSQSFLETQPTIYNHKIESWEVKSLDFNTVKNCFGGSDFETVFSLYALVGGVPSYLNAINPKKTLKDNILKTLLDKNSFLWLEAPLLIANIFDDSKVYLTVLKAIGLGSQKYADLIQKTSLNSNQLSVYLNSLIKLGLVKRLLPVTAWQLQNSKKGLYFISDYFLRFYFSFVFPNLTLIESGNLELLYKNNFETIEKLISCAYQEASRDFILEKIAQKKLPNFQHLGRWYNDYQAISVVGLNNNDNQILFADSFWSNKNVGVEEFRKLKNKAKLVEWQSGDRTEFFVLISNKGFSSELIKISKEQNLYLIKQDQLVSLF